MGRKFYNSAGADPDFFRVQIENAAWQPLAQRATVEVVRLPAGGGEVIVDSETQNLTANNDNAWRGLGKRLVTDSVDANGPRRLLAQLGDTVRLTYRARYRDADNVLIEASPITKTLTIGRPSTEENNDPANQRKHDIRTLELRIHVFADANGNPSISQQDIDDDIRVLKERMAQATIEPLVVGATNHLALPADGSLDNGLTVSTFPFTSFNQGEQHIVGLNSVDDILDVFYIKGVADAGGNPKQAVAYIKSDNQTNNPYNPQGHNFIVMSTDFNTPFTLGHEVMHILLDSGHRDIPGSPQDPETSLFHDPTDGQNAVGATKRIGPNSDTKPAIAAGHGNTMTIRTVAETLP